MDRWNRRLLRPTWIFLFLFTAVLPVPILAQTPIQDWQVVGSYPADRVDRGGDDLLVSHWEGPLYRITPDGAVVELLDARPEGWDTADFEYLPEEGLLLIPTFLDNRVRALRFRR